jgi:hypothetical protein
MSVAGVTVVWVEIYGLIASKVFGKPGKILQCRTAL